MKERDEALSAARRMDGEDAWTFYRGLRNEVTSLQRKDKSNYLTETYKKMETENDMKNMYSLTKQLLGWKDGALPTMFQIEGRTFRKQSDLANIMIKHYEDKVQLIKQRLPRVRSDPLKYLKRSFNKWLPPGRIPEFELSPATQGEICVIVKNLKNSHAYGTDRIDAASVKVAAKYFNCTNYTYNESVPWDRNICTKVENWREYSRF